MKIYTKRFKGKYRNIKDGIGLFLLFIYMVGAWVTYDRGLGITDQAFLIDLTNKRAYVLGMIIWPDELYYLTIALTLGAFGLFIVTSLFGRIWCGYTCPHTVMVDLFMLIENIFQGDRNARIKLDASEFSAEKFIKKSLTHITWLLLSFLFGFGWVGYFYGSKQLLHDLLTCSVGVNGTLWISGLTVTTYLFGGFLREKVCMHMCPYGRFQSALCDQETTVVTYHNWRGEPRGEDGDCIDCNQCVIACPMGIDIRNGLQMSCIGCGLCIDACNNVMEKIGKPKQLIEYSSVNLMKMLQNGIVSTRQRFVRPKIIIYSAVFLMASSFLAFSLFTKEETELQVDRINTPIFTITPDGSVRNSYNLIITNKTYIPHNNICLSVQGVDGMALKMQWSNEYDAEQCFTLNPGETLQSKVILLLPYEKLFTSKSKEIVFVLNSGQKAKSVFYVS